MTYYNPYRKRHYNLSSSQKRKYAQEMNELETYLEQSPYTYSTYLDSIYHQFEGYKVRISNHKPNSKYHDMSDTTSNVLVDIRCSKKNFISFIENQLEEIETALSYIDLTYYNYIQVKPASKTLVCYLKGYKTKKVELFY